MNTPKTSPSNTVTTTIAVHDSKQPPATGRPATIVLCPAFSPFLRKIILRPLMPGRVQVFGARLHKGRRPEAGGREGTTGPPGSGYTRYPQMSVTGRQGRRGGTACDRRTEGGEEGERCQVMRSEGGRENGVTRGMRQNNGCKLSV